MSGPQAVVAPSNGLGRLPVALDLPHRSMWSVLEGDSRGLHEALAEVLESVQGASVRAQQANDAARRRQVEFEARLSALHSYLMVTENAVGKLLASDPVAIDLRREAVARAASAEHDHTLAFEAGGPGAPTRLAGEPVVLVDRAVRRAGVALTQLRSKVFGGRLRREVVDQFVEVESVLRSVRELSERIKSEKWEAESEAAAQFQSDVQPLVHAAVVARRRLEAGLAEGSPVARRGWVASDWEGWTPPVGIDPIHLAQIAPHAPILDDPVLSVLRQELSLTLDIRLMGAVHLSHEPGGRSSALSSGRSLVARLLAAVPPGRARFTFFDPLGLGEAVAPFLALGDHDQKLIDGKVWTSSDDLHSRLGDLAAHIEQVIQKYLRGEYATIADYNHAAGEIAEPYRFLVIHDFPTHFDERTLHQLSRVIENGPRCGVFTVLIGGPWPESPGGGTPVALPGSIVTLNGPGLRIATTSGELVVRTKPDVDPLSALGAGGGQQVIDRIVDQVGRAGRGAENVTVDLPKALRLHEGAIRAGVRSDLPAGTVPASLADSSTWWLNDTVTAVAAPVGQSGARDVALLRFDSESLSGGVLIGRPGSGKSTLIHTFIGGLCSLYPPHELDLYLVDFKEGVEFKAYAEHGLPHARCVAVETERDFGVSVLESIVEEMKRRGELIRATGGEVTSFPRLRAAISDPLPRIVLVFDEFHVLFAENDRVGAKAADLLETIIRQGRGFGVHVLLGSQSLAGLDALGRHVLQLLPVRIVLPGSEADSMLVLGDGNDAWRMLTRRGEGVLNAAGGAVEANVPFQAAYESEEDRLDRLDELRSMAERAGFSRRPVVFEGHGAARLDASDPGDLRSSLGGLSSEVVPLRVGMPMSLGGPIDIELRRRAGANVLLVSKDAGGSAVGSLVAGLTTAAISPSQPRIELVLFASGEEGGEDAFAPLLDTNTVTLTRRRGAGKLVEAIAAEVRRRLDEDDYRAASILLVLHGLHRARDLEADAPATASFGEVPEPGMLDQLREILVDGPDVGVHTIASVDSVGSLARRLPRNLRREFGQIITGAMSGDDSRDLIDSEMANTLKPNQLVVYDDDAGSSVRARGFCVPAPEWLEAALAAKSSAFGGAALVGDAAPA